MKKEDKKYLLIFDFDKTILNDDSFGFLFMKALTKEEKEEIYRLPRNQNWVIGFNYTLKKIKSHGTTLNEFNKILEELPLTKGMLDLFSYIEKQKSKFEVVLMSGDYEYVIKYLLKYHKIYDLFSDIICTPSRISNSEEEDQFIYVLEKKPHNCKICNPCNCKSQDFKEFCLSHDINQYENVIFICDGWNDFCLAKILSNRDIVFARKNFALYKKLFENNLKSEINCKVEGWEDGKDIIKFLQSLK